MQHCATSKASKAKWWNSELLAESDILVRTLQAMEWTMNYSGLSSHLLPALHVLKVVRDIVCIKQDEVHVRGQLRGGGENEGDGGQDDHRQRHKSINLKWKSRNLISSITSKKIVKGRKWWWVMALLLCYCICVTMRKSVFEEARWDWFVCTWAAREVSGYSVKFHKYFLTTPYFVVPKSSSLSLSSYFCWFKFSDSISCRKF